MKKYIPLLILFVFIFWGLFNCNSPTDSDEPNPENMVVLTGLVEDYDTGTPIGNAVVYILNYTPEQTTVSNAEGIFTFEFEVDQSVEVGIVAVKENFIADTISVLAVPGRTINDLNLRLSVGSGTPISSGVAASIIIKSVSAPTISVRGSGGQEVSDIVFEAQDSSGTPIDLDHSVSVNFFLGASPGGGEFLYPNSNMTGNEGKVSTSLFSGIKAGVVQIIAMVNQNGQIYRSQPVPIVIHGGLPDSAHFSIAVEQLNFPGYNIYGLTDGITAYVGDKYGNPVKPETAVYFTTTGGLIEGSAFTNLLGEATVNLLSAAPKPLHPILGAGFATVTARTADENQNTIEASGLVLFSGIPQIFINPGSINVPNLGSQSFSYTVSDQNGNPLAGGTSIRVSVETGDVEAVGNTDITLPDTQSPAWTNFGFSLVDTTPDTSLVNNVSVKISTTGPNGNLEVSISGIAH